MAHATATLPLQLTLADVARLARVQRPVVSVWRTRSAATPPPFPAPCATVRGEDRFDAAAVIEWLEATGRGNNPDARADAAAFASPLGLSEADDELVGDGLAALLTLKEITGRRLADLADDELLDLADDADPDDELLLAEIDALGGRRQPLARYADDVADAAYHSAEAFERLARRFGRPGAALHESVHDLVTSLAAALAVDAGLDPAVYVDPTCGGSDLLVSLAGRDEGVGLATVMTARHDDRVSRQARRRLRVHGVHSEPVEVDDDGAWAVPRPAVHLAEYPSPGRPAMSPAEILTAVDNLVLQMDERHRAVVVAPASVLVDRLRDRRADELRDALLRHGSLRAVIRLPNGLVIAKPRQALALWVLGPAHGDVPVQDRWTMTADLTDVRLDVAAGADLVSDLVVAMADRRAVTAHALRFARPVPTRSLLAGGGSLVAHGSAAPPSSRTAGPELAVRIGELAELVGSGVAALPTGRTGAGPVALGDAAAANHVRMIAGNRLDPSSLPAGTVRVIGTEELAGGGSVARGVDRLAFEASHARGRYTEPGDVVVCTSPRPRALVDAEGGAVVVAPARTLRIDADAPGGLLADVLAADVNALPATARSWRHWPLRRVPDAQRVALADALAALGRQRDAAMDRLAHLDELTRLVTRGVASGALTLTDSEKRG